MNEAPFLEKLSEMTRVPVGQLTDDLEIDPSTWDSVDVLDVISAIDEVYGTTVPIDALNASKTLGELRALIRSSAGK